MTDPVLKSLRHQFEEVFLASQTSRSYRRPPEAFKTSGGSYARPSTQRPSSADRATKFGEPYQPTTVRPYEYAEATHSSAYTKLIEQENAELRRKVSTSEADRLSAESQVKELRSLTQILEGRIAQLEIDNATLRTTRAHAPTFSPSSRVPQERATTPQMSPSAISRSASSAETIECKPSPSSCFRRSSSPSKNLRVAFNKDLQVAHFHTNDFRVFKAASYPLRDSSLVQSSYSSRSAQQIPKQWIADSPRLKVSRAQIKGPFSVVRYK
jgi:hypothetical protein